MEESSIDLKNMDLPDCSVMLLKILESTERLTHGIGYALSFGVRRELSWSASLCGRRCRKYLVNDDRHNFRGSRASRECRNLHGQVGWLVETRSRKLFSCVLRHGGVRLQPPTEAGFLASTYNHQAKTASAGAHGCY